MSNTSDRFRLAFSRVKIGSTRNAPVPTHARPVEEIGRRACAAQIVRTPSDRSVCCPKAAEKEMIKTPVTDLGTFVICNNDAFYLTSFFFSNENHTRPRLPRRPAGVSHTPQVVSAAQRFWPAPARPRAFITDRDDARLSPAITAVIVRNNARSPKRGPRVRLVLKRV